MKSTKYYSNIQERTVARNLGGKQVAGSGASKFSLGDVRAGDYTLIECKTSMTEKSSYSIKREVLEKIRDEAIEMHKFYSALAFNFGPDTDNYYVISEDMMKFLLEKINEEYK